MHAEIFSASFVWHAGSAGTTIPKPMGANTVGRCDLNIPAHKKANCPKQINEIPMGGIEPRGYCCDGF